MSDGSRLTRRALIELGAIAPLAALAGCGSESPPSGTRVDLSALAEGERLVVLHGEEPVELVRRLGELEARSLWCTHMGCAVRWEEHESRYRCACHGGVYDAEGRPLAGPPRRPLRRVPFVLEGELVILPFDRHRPPAGVSSRPDRRT